MADRPARDLSGYDLFAEWYSQPPTDDGTSPRHKGQPPSLRRAASTSDWELWARATYLDQHLGAQAAFFITERLVPLAAQGDNDGVLAWRGIANRFDHLRAGHQGPFPT